MINDKRITIFLTTLFLQYFSLALLFYFQRAARLVLLKFKDT